MYTKNNNPKYFIENPLEGNCGSFALNIKEWYLSDRDFDNTSIVCTMLEEEGYNVEEALDYLTSINVQQILDDFGSDIRVITNKDDINKGEELIAYRIGIFEEEDFPFIDTDFHFKVKRNGIWMEKCGSTEVKFCELEEDEEWHNNSGDLYNGPIVFLAKKI